MTALAPLRHDLDIMPSPAPDRPGLFVRDPLRFSDAMIVIPWALAPCLRCFDGSHSDGDLRDALARITGENQAGSLKDELLGALRESGFLEDETFAQMRAAREREFERASERCAVHAGFSYPAERDALDQTMRGYLDPRDLQPDGLAAVAAPHVSPFGGWQSYQAAYRKLPSAKEDRTFIILGTSHYGEPDKFGLTRKRFTTPLGTARTDETIVRRLAEKAASATKLEDYCHSVEHSIEFQVLFLQWIYGPEITIVPILCGSFLPSIRDGGMPEDNAANERFFGELAEISAARGDSLFWVLGIDMAHIGRRYHDTFDARASEGYMQEVARRDAERNERVAAGDAAGFWSLVQPNGDDLRWCGSSPLYTFLKTHPGIRGTVERYDQWNIDEKSVVTFAGITFSRGQ